MKIDKEKGKRIYPDAPDWLKQELEEEFGKDFFVESNYEKIKTFEDACAALQIKVESVLSKNDTPDEAAYKKLKVIVKAINEGWIPNWNDTDQAKYWPWFKLSSGFGFSDSACEHDYTNASVGSRLCFKDSKRCIYTANQFLDIYKEYITINN